MGYVKPSDPLLDGAFERFEQIAKLGYMAPPGARCPDCRGASANEALTGLPRDWPHDPIERIAYEYEHYGLAATALPEGRWGPLLAEALKRRGVPFGKFRHRFGGWTSSSPSEVDGRPVWTFASRGAAGQVSGMSAPEVTENTIFVLDANGESPVDRGRWVGGRFLSGKRWEPDVRWEVGPPPSPAANWLLVAQALSAAHRADFRFPEPKDVVGQAPAALYALAVAATDERRAELLSRSL